MEEKRSEQLSEGVVVSAYVFSEHEDGTLIIFAPGSFDKWCVYVGIPCKLVRKPETRDDYPLKHYDLSVVSKSRYGVSFNGEFVNSPYKCRYHFEAPQDIVYLNSLRTYSKEKGGLYVWNQFLSLYDVIPQEHDIVPTRKLVSQIYRINHKFAKRDVRKTFDVLALAMIAENNRTYPYLAKLGKKVKALGAYQSIFTDMDMLDIANFSKNMSWKELDKHCLSVGITTPNLR